MKINITALNFELTDTLKKNIEERFDRHLKAFTDNITNLYLTLSTNKLVKIAEAKAHVPGNTIFAKAETEENMLAAINTLLDKLARQLKKHKEKNKDWR